MLVRKYGSSEIDAHEDAAHQVDAVGPSFNLVPLKAAKTDMSFSQKCAQFVAPLGV